MYFSFYSEEQQFFSGVSAITADFIWARRTLPFILGPAFGSGCSSSGVTLTSFLLPFQALAHGVDGSGTDVDCPGSSALDVDSFGWIEKLEGQNLALTSISEKLFCLLVGC